MKHALYCFGLAAGEFGGFLKSVFVGIFFSKDFWLALKAVIIFFGGIGLIIATPAFIAYEIFDNPDLNTNTAALSFVVFGWVVEGVIIALIVRARTICKEQKAQESI